VSVGVVALDGTAIGADASRAATRSHEQIRQEVEQMLAEAAEVDAREDELYGDARGDQFPAELVDRRSRLARLRRCREELEAEQARAEIAYQKNLRWRAEWEAEHGRKLGGRKPFAPDPDGLSKRTINTTDSDSRVILRDGRQPVQGYNAQAVATAGQIVVAADITQQSNDSGQLEPMIREVVDTLSGLGQEWPIGVVLADGGYWNKRAHHRARQRRYDRDCSDPVGDPDQGPEAVPETRARGRADRPVTGHAGRQGALHPPPAHDRDRLRRYEAQPWDPPVQPTRISRLPRRGGG
jgi:hypothetical protein